jgi:cell division initiation protein
MAYTPVEVRHIRLKRALFGYRRGMVDRTLTDVADSFEDVYRERGELTDKVEALETELVRHRELETLLRTTLMSAEKAAHELKDQARREAQLILEEAHAVARAITREAVAERERLETNARRVRTLLTVALDAVEDAQIADGEDAPEPEAEAA